MTDDQVKVIVLSHLRGRSTPCPSCNGRLDVQEDGASGEDFARFQIFCKACDEHGVCRVTDAERP
jgi:hypothetical protein